MAEAMFNGCLVIGKNTGGSKEQMDNGLQFGGQEIALRYQSSAELSRLLERVTQQYSSFLPLIDKAFHIVNALYTTEANVEQVYQFYQDILHTNNH